MSWRKVLGVNKDATLKDCKRAYVKLIKIVRPDEQPDEFMTIRNAYESAQKFYSDKKTQPIFQPSKTKSQVPITKFEFDESSSSSLEIEDNSPQKNNFDEYETIKYQNNLELESNQEEFREKLLIFYNDIDKRNNVQAWQQLFNGMSLKEEENVQYILPDFLNKNCDLSDEVWSFLDEAYELSETNNFEKKHRLEYPTYFNYALNIPNSEHKVKYFRIRNQLYYHLLELEIHDEEEMIETLKKLKYILTQDIFFYELLLKKLRERQVYDDIMFFKPNQEVEKDLYEVHQTCLGLYFNSVNNYEDALSCFGKESMFDIVGKYKALLALDLLKYSKKLVKFRSVFGNTHFILKHARYSKTKIKKLQNSSISKRVFREAYLESRKGLIVRILAYIAIASVLLLVLNIVLKKVKVIVYLIVGYYVMKVVKNKFGKG